MRIALVIKRRNSGRLQAIVERCLDDGVALIAISGRNAFAPEA